MLVAWLVALATAQTPTPSGAPALPPGLPPGFPSIPLTVGGAPATPAQTRWLATDAVAERFPGEATPGPKFVTGEEVTLLIEENGKSRIFADDKYGWVPTKDLTQKQPAAAPTAAPGSSDLLGGLKPLLPPKK